MGELVVNMFTSLDGVLQGPGAPEEDREGGFEYGGWQAPYLDEESGKVITDHIAGLEALLLGRKTYEIFAAYWPQQPAENPIAARLNGAPKYVASRTLDTVGWTNSKLIRATWPRRWSSSRGSSAEWTSSAAGTSCRRCCATIWSTG